MSQSKPFLIGLPIIVIGLFAEIWKPSLDFTLNKKKRWRTIMVIAILFLFISSGAAKANELHEGDFIIEDQQTLIIKDRTLEIDGNFILKENATLTLENSTLIIKERYKSEHRFLADGAHIKIINSEIVSSENTMVEKFGKLTGSELNIILNSTDILVEDSEVYGRVSGWLFSAKIKNSSVSYVYWNYNSNVEINNSLLGAFVFDCKEGKSEKLTFNGLEKDKNINFVLENVADGGSVKLHNSNIKGMWSFNLEYGCNKDITVKNSDIENFWIKFPPTDNRIKIDGLPTGLLQEFKLEESVSGITLPYSLTLLNVKLNEFKPEMLGTKAEITNSYAMVHPYDECDLIIKDSTLINLFNYGSKRIEFINTTLTDTMQLLHKPEFANGFQVDGKTIGEGGYFDFIFKNSTLDVSALVIANIEGKMQGELKILAPKNLNDIQWVKGIITRTYPVITDPYMEVKLWDGDTIKWSVQTDNAGRASFDITFDKETYTKEFIIEAGGSKKNVSFLTNTPIDFYQHKSETENKGDKVYLIVVFIFITFIITGYFAYRKIKKH